MCLHNCNSACTTSAFTAFTALPVCAFVQQGVTKSSSTPQAVPTQFSVLEPNGNGPFSTFNPKAAGVSADDELLHTYAEFFSTPNEALAFALDVGSWALCIEIPLPVGTNPTLRRLEYMVSYATMHDTGNAVIQTDALLTTHALPAAPVVTGTGIPGLVVYNNDTGAAPFMIQHEEALRFSSTLAVMAGGECGAWGRYVDSRVVAPDTRIVDDNARLYLVFRVNEHPTPKTLRDIAIRASATWQKEEVVIKALAAAKAAAEAEAKKVAAEKEAEKARYEEERQDRMDTKAWRDGERLARQTRDEEERKERVSAQAYRDEEKAARIAREKSEESSHKQSEVGHTADLPTQNQIKAAIERLGLAKCPNGYAFVRTADGWSCTGGQHKITDAQLAASR